MRKQLTVTLCVFSAFAFVSSSDAQIMAPLLQKHVVEAGYAYKWFDRDIPAPVDNAEWEVASLFGRFGAFDWLTITAEGGLWSVERKNFPDEPYTRWVVGGGVSAPVLRAERWSIIATVAYNEVFDHDKTPSRFDKRTRGWNAGVLAGTSLAFWGQQVDLWGGPMFVDDLIERYAWGVDVPFATEADTKFGGAAGAYAVLFEYVSGFAYVLYADHPQLRLGVSVRSRGDE